MEKINADDLKELEDILWHQLGTQDEFTAEAQDKTLAEFVRSLIGLDQDAVNKKFGEFLNSNMLTSQQQEFVKAIIDYVRANGNISKEDLFKDPFADYNVADLFGELCLFWLPILVLILVLRTSMFMFVAVEL